MATASVVATGAATAAIITPACCDCDAQIAGTTWSKRWTINVIAQYYSATTIAIDDD